MGVKTGEPSRRPRASELEVERSDRLEPSQPLVALRVAMLLSQRLDATSALLVELQKENKGRPAEAGIFGRLMSALVTPGKD